MNTSTIVPQASPFVFTGKLIKSSVYRVNGMLARFTGEYVASLPVFKVHDSALFHGGTVQKVTREEVMEYMGR